MSIFKTACVILSVIGLVVGLACGLIGSMILIALVELGSIALGAWGAYKTFFVYHNRYEFIRWSGFAACVILAEPVGYLLGMLRWWLVS